MFGKFVVCYHPISGYVSDTVNPSGKRSIVFNRSDSTGREQQVPCGQCIGCRLERSRQWAVRCYHEASLFDHNCFVTLTYDDDHMPLGNSLDKTHLQLFMKRLRKRFEGIEEVSYVRGNGTVYSHFPIRFFACGEYSDKGRPHYHILIFNFDFMDKLPLPSKSSHQLYISPSLSDLWKYGIHSIGDVTFDSAAYVARYCMKKVNGEDKDEHYSRFDPYTGELHSIMSEFSTQSRRPGVGNSWYEYYSDDVYTADYCIIDGRKVKAPKFYDNKFEIDDPSRYIEIKAGRKALAKLQKDNQSTSRLKVRETVAMARLKTLTRSLE